MARRSMLAGRLGSGRCLAGLALAWLACACSDEERPGTVSVGDAMRRDGGADFAPAFPGASGVRGAAAGADDGTGGGSMSADDPACGTTSAPVDVILIVDTSGSMLEEILAVQDNINDNFARILEAQNVDYRLVLLAEFGEISDERFGICVSQPLSGADCDPLPEGPQGSERFLHYSVTISSLDALCQVLDTFSLPDPWDLAPSGWQAHLRPDALKIFVVVTDDATGCASTTTAAIFPEDLDPEQTALDFDSALVSLSGIQFAGTGERNYKWYSIVGLVRGAMAGEPLVDETCPTAPTAGLGYQALSNLTQSGRYPVCEGNSFPEAFRAIAEEVVEEAFCQR